MESTIPRAAPAVMDPETEFLMSKRETGNEWEMYKENVRPLKRGRKVQVLNHALKSHSHSHSLLKNSLLQHRRKMIEAIDEYQGDDPLQPWLDCIKWVQEAFPHGGDYSGLVVIYEQCVRTFWHSDRYKDDLRYLKVWIEYAENCSDAEVIYSFLDANGIGKTHALYYISHALYMESKNKVKAANEIFNLGISRDAQPIEKLKDAFRKFVMRSMSKPKVTDEESTESSVPARSFGTVLAGGGSRRQTENSVGKKRQRPDRAPLSIYKDNSDIHTSHQSDASKTSLNSWKTIGARADRNKENNSVPTKWTTYKIPQKPVSRGGQAAMSSSIEVFVDEECDDGRHRSGDDNRKSSTLQLRRGNETDMKKETELLRENPLRHFPPSSLPR